MMRIRWREEGGERRDAGARVAGVVIVTRVARVALVTLAFERL